MNALPPSTLRARWLALTGLLLAGGGLVAFITRRQRLSSSQQPITDLPMVSHEQLDTHNPLSDAIPTSDLEAIRIEPKVENLDPKIANPESGVRPLSSSPLNALLRLFAFIGVTVVAALGLIALQSQSTLVSAPVFVLLLVGSLVFAGWSAPDASERSIRSVVATVQEGITIFLDFRRGVRRRTGLASVCMALAILGMAYSAFQFYQAVVSQSLPRTALQWLLIGIVLMGAAMLFNRPAIPVFAIPDRAVTHAPAAIRRQMVVPGLVALVVLAEVNGGLLGLGLQAHYLVQLGLLLLGILLLVIGFGGWEWRLPRVTRQEALLLVGLMTLAFFPRTIGLETLVHRFVDEIHYAGAVAHLWADPFTRILTPFAEVTAFTWFYPIVQAGSVGVFGAGLGALRLPSIIVGALTVPAIYFLARTLFDRRTAIIAALLLTTFPPHVHFSRLALNNIVDPFLGTLALAFLFRGLKNGRRSDYVMAGAMLGLTQYFYEGGRLLYPPLLIVSFIIGWLLLKRGRADLRHAAFGLLVAVLIAAPFYYTLFAAKASFIPRMNQEGITPTELNNTVNNLVTPDKVYQRFAHPFLMYTGVSDFSWFYGGYHPIVLRYFVPTFLLGLAVLLWRWRLLGALPLLIWLLATSLGNVFIRDSAWTPRYVVAFPAVVLLMAIGLRHVLPLIWPEESRPRLRQRAIILLLTVMVGGQFVYYFGDHMPIFDRQFRRTTDFEDALFRAREFPPGTHVYIVAPYAIWFYNLGIWHEFFDMNLILQSRHPNEIDSAFLNDLPAGNDYAFFIEQNDAETLAKLQRHFQLLPPELSPYNLAIEYQLVLYRAPHSQQQQ